jgi:hypothetical protein
VKDKFLKATPVQEVYFSGTEDLPEDNSGPDVAHPDDLPSSSPGTTDQAADDFSDSGDQDNIDDEMHTDEEISQETYDQLR